MPAASNIHRYIRRTNTPQRSGGCDTICQMGWRYESGPIECKTLTRSLIATLMCGMTIRLVHVHYPIAA